MKKLIIKISNILGFITECVIWITGSILAGGLILLALHYCYDFILKL